MTATWAVDCTRRRTPAPADQVRHEPTWGTATPLLVRPDRKDQKKRKFGSLGGMRQWIELVYDTLKDQLGLEHHGVRTPEGVFARIAQRLLALAATI